MLEIKNITYKYQENNVFENFFLNIPFEKNIGIIGRNGSGKSTLAKIISGVLEINDGEIQFTGRNAEVKDEVYLILQNPDNQIFRTHVYEEITFGAENLNIPKKEIEKKIKYLTEKLELEELLHKNIKELSGGQKQRINLASILIMEPKVLIMDESTSMISQNMKNKILKFLKEYQKKNEMTIIHITHDLTVVKNMDHLIELSSNEVLFEGVPKNFFKQLKNEENYEVPLEYKISENLNSNDFTKDKNNYFKNIHKHRNIKKKSEDTNTSENISMEKNREKKMDKTITSLKNVSFYYDRNDNFKLKNISLDFKIGKIYAIVGNNGSGKSTLIQLINTLLLPKKGIVKIDGEEITIKSKKKKLIKYKQKNALVFQFSDLQFFGNTVLGDMLTVAKNEKKNLEIVQKEIEKYLETFEISKEVLKKNPNNLSGGEKKKIAIISVLINKPEILILDEPTNNLDPRSKKLLMKILLKLKKEKKMTIILNTHDYEFMTTYCEEIIEMNDGNIIYQNNIYEFLKKKISEESIFYLPEMYLLILKHIKEKKYSEIEKKKIFDKIENYETFEQFINNKGKDEIY